MDGDRANVSSDDTTPPTDPTLERVAFLAAPLRNSIDERLAAITETIRSAEWRAYVEEHGGADAQGPLTSQVLPNRESPEPLRPDPQAANRPQAGPVGPANRLQPPPPTAGPVPSRSVPARTPAARSASRQPPPTGARPSCQPVAAPAAICGRRPSTPTTTSEKRPPDSGLPHRQRSIADLRFPRCQ